MVKRDWGDTFTGAAGEYHDYDFYNDMYLDILENPLVSDLGFAGYDAVDIGKLYFEATDFINYATDTYSFNIADTSEFEISATQIDFKANNLVNVGTIGTGTFTLTINETKSLSDKQDNLSFGIADTNSVVIDSATVANLDYAKFTTTGLEGRSYTEVKQDLSLDNVENTTLSTWAGSANITTVGTIGTGTWQGDAIADAYIATDYLPLAGGTLTGALYVGTNEIGHSVGNGVTFADDGDATFAGNIYTTSSGWIMRNLSSANYTGIYWDGTNIVEYHAPSQLTISIANTAKAYYYSDRIMFRDEVRFENDNDFKIYNDSGTHKLQFDSSDWIGYTTATNVLYAQQGNVTCLEIGNYNNEYCDFIGLNAGNSQTGIRSNGFGYNALFNNIKNYANGIGHSVLYYNTGTNSNGIGAYALNYNTGDDSNGFGYHALYYNDSDDATAIGHESFNNFDEDNANEKSFDNTDVDTVNDRLTITTHGFGANDSYRILRYEEGTSAITGLTDQTLYQIKIIDANTIEFTTANITDAGSGTGHKMIPRIQYNNSTALGYNAEPTASNQVMLGDTNVTEVYSYGAGNFRGATLGDGGTTDYISIDDNGCVSLHGAAECELTLRPSLETGPIFLFSVPTVGTVGAVSYYSLPIWNSDNEQLFFKQTVPGRWDGSSDLTFRLYVMLGGAEDVDDTFKFQFSWSHCQEEGTMSSSVSDDVEVQQAVLIDRTAEYSCYRLEFTINYDVDGAGDELKSGETLFGRLRRIASTGTAVTNEIRVTNWDITYHIDKFAKGCGS